VRALLIECDEIDARSIRVRVSHAGASAIRGPIIEQAALLMLGSRFIAAHDASEMAELLDDFGGVVLLVVDRVAQQRANMWALHRIGTFVRPERAAVEARLRLDRRPFERLSPREWIGPLLGRLGPADRAVLRVPRLLDAVTANLWAETCAMSLRELREFTRRSIGRGPREALLDYRLRGARSFLAAERPQRAVAPAFGYSDRTALSRVDRSLSAKVAFCLERDCVPLLGHEHRASSRW